MLLESNSVLATQEITSLGELDRSQWQRWDVCDWQALRPNSPLLRASPALAWRDQVVEQEVSPVLELPATVEDWAAAGPSSLLRKTKYFWRRAAQLGPVRIEQADGSNFEELFGALLRLHAARWGARGTPGVLRDPKVQRFHEEVAREFAARGLLRLYALSVAGQWAAGCYAFQHRARAYYYIGGFDPRFAQFSPGTLLVGHAIEHAIREGAAEFDFLRGAEPCDDRGMEWVAGGAGLG